LPRMQLQQLGEGGGEGELGCPPEVLEGFRILEGGGKGAAKFEDGTYPDECCICMEPFLQAQAGGGAAAAAAAGGVSDGSGEGAAKALCDEPVVQVDCGHVFHKECLGGWLKKHKVCPLCRKEFYVPPKGGGGGGGGEHAAAGV
jgi:hypothetical protein